MPKRVAITGLPCPPEVWHEFLESPQNLRSELRVLPMLEVLEKSQTNDLRMLSDYVAQVLDEERPESILCHDFGVPLTLLALLKLCRRGEALSSKITIFNGAFRKMEVFRQSLPYRIHFMTYEQALRETSGQGGKVDPRLKSYLPRIRAIYRSLIAYSVTEKVQSLLGFDDVIPFSARAILKNPIQIIASPNDPYVPLDCIEQLKKDFGAQRVLQVEYGHFPYSIPRNQILPLIEEFESLGPSVKSSRTPPLDC